ncbi:hypothetical protein M378DRAFT_11667 [Amanita muscaria Koide BX008]|uniref:Uncharacterized protein n=1 Tax=Amanita muscaria (strain Koide BX008) TaxID=946122 RepID=A0A0C2X5U2_AMAMK|nr:hypothetical protein M378DRAFT_11667 [Amanita muscaria Koide BX008]
MSDDEGDDEDRERGGLGAEMSKGEEGEDEQDMVDIEDGNATVHVSKWMCMMSDHENGPFSNTTPIHFALPKLWKAAPRRSRHLNWQSGAGLDDDDAHDDRLKRKSRGAAKRGKSELPGLEA